MIAVYYRVSSDKQSTETQDHAVLEYARKKGWTVIKYVDEAITGKHTKRPAFQRLMADCRKKKIKRILTFELSRLTRDMDDNQMMMAELTHLDVTVETLKDGVIPFDSPEDKLKVAIFAYMAQKERENTAQRTKAGMARARDERNAKIAEGIKPKKQAIGFPGTKAGRAKAAKESWVHPKKGYRKDYRAEDPDLYDDVLELAGDGLTYRKIARMLSRNGRTISHQKVYRILKRS